jgi:hypothetical protein
VCKKIKAYLEGENNMDNFVNKMIQNRETAVKNIEYAIAQNTIISTKENLLMRKRNFEIEIEFLKKLENIELPEIEKSLIENYTLEELNEK